MTQSLCFEIEPSPSSSIDTVLKFTQEFHHPALYILNNGLSIKASDKVGNYYYTAVLTPPIPYT